MFNPSAVVHTLTVDEVRGQSQTDTRKFIEPVKFKHKKIKVSQNRENFFQSFFINLAL